MFLRMFSYSLLLTNFTCFRYTSQVYVFFIFTVMYDRFFIQVVTSINFFLLSFGIAVV